MQAAVTKNPNERVIVGKSESMVVALDPATTLSSNMQPTPFVSAPVAPAPRQGAQMQVQRVMKSLSSMQVAVQRSLASTRELDERFTFAQKRADETAAAYLHSAPDEFNREGIWRFM